MKNIAIVGAGIIGLTTASTLLKKGNRITIYCEKLPGETTSVKAGAVWLPFLTEPKEKVYEWAKYAYQIFREGAERGEDGVEMTWLHVFANTEGELDFQTLLPANEFQMLKKSELPSDVKAGCRIHVPLMESPKYLAALFQRLTDTGVKIIQQKIKSLNELMFSFDAIVNCTGLGARELVNDQSVIPISGQIVKTERMENALCFTNKTDADQPVYLFTRRDGCILGGSAVRNDFSETPDPELAKNILERVLSFEPGIHSLKILDEYVGLRPWRPSVRLEREQGTNIIHNYGHGGSGWTVSWGCALDVAQLLD